jgi:hypothetical protein
MAQTKRKRRTKHRGNAAGKVEARGRTGRRPSAEEVKAGSRNGRRRELKEPTWRSAATKAAVMAVVLFGMVMAGILGNKASISAAVFLGLIGFALYTPLAYMTDRAFYRHQLKRQAAGKG